MERTGDSGVKYTSIYRTLCVHWSGWELQENPKMAEQGNRVRMTDLIEKNRKLSVQNL